jgi:hypothetical protein
MSTVVTAAIAGKPKETFVFFTRLSQKLFAINIRCSRQRFLPVLRVIEWHGELAVYVISHEWQAQIVCRKLFSLYSVWAMIATCSHYYLTWLILRL